jgi:hypothetical protein
LSPKYLKGKATPTCSRSSLEDACGRYEEGAVLSEEIISKEKKTAV